MPLITNENLLEMADCKIDTSKWPPIVYLKKPGRDENGDLYEWVEAFGISKAVVMYSPNDLPRVAIDYLMPYVEAYGRLDGPSLYIMSEILRSRGYEVTPSS